MFCPSLSFAMGSLSIIIDDVGYRASDKRLLELPDYIMLSVLPSAPFAQTISAQAKAQKRDIMLHLPMQSKSGYKPETDTLTSQMNTKQLQQRLLSAIRKLPNSVGVNNHMGSLLTENPRAMLAVMQVLKEKKLFFVDSRTSQNSVAFQIAKDLGVSSFKRHIFLDNQKDPVKIGVQLDKALQLAQKGYPVIAIGHPYPETIQVLQQYLARADKVLGISLRSIAELNNQ